MHSSSYAGLLSIPVYEQNLLSILYKIHLVIPYHNPKTYPIVVVISIFSSRIPIYPQHLFKKPPYPGRRMEDASASLVEDKVGLMGLEFRVKLVENIRPPGPLTK